MKKLLIAAAVAGTMVSGVAFANDTHTINFENGSLKQSMCSFKKDAQVVGLPQDIQTNLLHATGEVAGEASVNIELVGCPGPYENKTSVALKFTGGNITNGKLTNNGGTARNVAVQLLKDDSPIDLSSPDHGAKVNLAHGIKEHTINLKAQYVAVGGAATAGTVSTSTTVELEYK